MSEQPAQTLHQTPEGPAEELTPRFRRRLGGAVRMRFVPGAIRDIGAAGDIPEARSTDDARRRDAIYRRTLATADMLAATFAILVALPGLGADGVTPLAVVGYSLSIVLVGKVAGLYDRDQHLIRKTTLDEAPDLFRVATLYTLIVFIGGDVIVHGPLGSDQGLGLWALLFVFMLVNRAAGRRIARLIAPEERCLVLGDHEAGAWLASKLAGSHGHKAQIVGRVALDVDPPGANGLPILGDYDTLGVVLAAHDIDRVVIVPGNSQADHILDAVRLVKALGVKVSVLPRLFEVMGSSVEFDEIDGAMVLGLRGYGLSRSSGILKRSLDLAGSAFGILLIAPLLAMIAIAIKLDTRGPVFFRQRRMGRLNTPFDMLKFRTMVDGAESQKGALIARNEAGDGLFKIEDDPRITRVGKFLRRTSLDELPQLFNVLRGDMALVGPRPLVIDEDARIDGWRRRRLLLTPGMTGLWQVFGSARIPMQEMVKIDYMYGANWSLWLDVKILLRTVPFVLGRRGL
jgi:exopolysaccharide biosynthesis polyprenyl glycosylphosphotransferase